MSLHWSLCVGIPSPFSFSVPSLFCSDVCLFSLFIKDSTPELPDGKVKNRGIRH